MIPNIEHRVEQYVTRSICALLSENLRERRRIEFSVAQLRELLEKLAQSFPDALYIPNAISELKARPDHYRKRADLRSPFVSTARRFLYSPYIRQMLASEPGLPGHKAAAGYPEKSLLFGDDEVTNPIRFLSAFSNDAKPSVLRSFWLLQQLAHGSKAL
jgi:hypothetical protein